MSSIKGSIRSSLKFSACFDCTKKPQCLTKQLTLENSASLDSFVSSNIQYQCGDYIYRQGDACKKIFIVKFGSTKSFINSVEGAEQVIGFKFPGEVLGLDALDTNEHVSSVMALENSIICGFSLHYIDTLCTADSAFQKEIIARFSREIVHEYQLLMLINKNSAEQRVAIFLLELLVRMGFSRGQLIKLNLCMSRADIANYLGLVPETVSRALSRFERLGIIIVKKKKLKIIDEQLLIKYSTHQNLSKPASHKEMKDTSIPLALLY